MPETSLIEYKQKKFWIPEPFIEILCHFICEAFEKSGIERLSDNLLNEYSCCDGNRSGACIGMVDMLFDHYIKTESDKLTMIEILQETKAIIHGHGEELSIELLNSIESNKVDDYFKDSWGTPIKTSSLIKTAHFMIQLLDGTWEKDNHGVAYIGFGASSHDIVV